MGSYHIESLIQRTNDSINSIEACLQHGIHQNQCVERLALRVLELVRGMNREQK